MPLSCILMNFLNFKFILFLNWSFKKNASYLRFPLGDLSGYVPKILTNILNYFKWSFIIKIFKKSVKILCEFMKIRENYQDLLHYYTITSKFEIEIEIYLFKIILHSNVHVRFQHTFLWLYLKLYAQFQTNLLRVFFYIGHTFHYILQYKWMNDGSQRIWCAVEWSTTIALSRFSQKYWRSKQAFKHNPEFKLPQTGMSSA